MDPRNNKSPQEAADLRALEQMADSIDPRPGFAERLEADLRAGHRPRRAAMRTTVVFRYAGLAAGLMLLAVVLNWLIGSLAPVSVPAKGGTPIPEAVTTGTPQAQLLPEGKVFEWRGTTLSLNAILPAGPAEAAVSQVGMETPATLESAAALANQFGLLGNAYQAPGEIPGLSGITITDGKARLYMRSDQYYTYWPDYPAFLNTAAVFPVTDAETQIATFMAAHGLDFPYRLQPAEFYQGYYALPLAEDGIATRYDYFKYSGLLFRFNAQGIVAVEASLIHAQPGGTYAIRPAQEALDLILALDVPGGILEGVHSPTGGYGSWYRARPLDTTLSIYAFPSLFKSLDGSAPLVTLDGYPVPGAGNVPEGFADANLIHATGQFTMLNGIQVFNVQSWEVYSGIQDGWMGTLQMQGDQAVLLTQEGETFTMPDLPSGLTLPMENVYVLGVKEGDVIQWSSFDLRMANGGRGGGGGGGLGLYKLNLSGTPIPFPTATPAVTALPPGSGYPYTVIAGDTIASIAAAFGITPEELMTANGFTDPATLFIGQILLIPEAQQADGWQGLLNLTIYKSADGSQRTQYAFAMDGGVGIYILQGDLSALDTYQNRPVKVWGTIHSDEANGSMVIQVEKYEIPYPDLAFTILQGRQSNQTVNGELLTLFAAQDGKTYVMLYPDGMLSSNPVEPGSEDVMAETLAIPGETYAGYPALRVFSSSLAENPKDGVTTVMPITADAPYTVIEPGASDMPEIPSAVIESVELVYFTRDTRYNPPVAGQVITIQPMWLFRGHYSNGDELEILVQALKNEYLSPETEPIEPPG